jgi:UDP-glucuronate 4-epimerase
MQSSLGAPPVVKVLVTGVAGFIGTFVAQALLARGDEVVGIDNLNDYYDPALKQSRLKLLTGQAGFKFHQMDIADEAGVRDVVDGVDRVCHLAAQAGVRYSFANPRAYVMSNLLGFFNVLEAAQLAGVEHLVYASSSSVYGANTKVPFSVDDSVDHPLSFYAATKKSNELMAHSFAHLHGLPVTGLRFFTVYGPWGRPDMALFRFTQMILAGEPIPVYSYGEQSRDFTYIDDIVTGVVQVIDRIPQAHSGEEGGDVRPGGTAAPYRVFNIGSQRPVRLMHFIEVLERSLGVKAKLDLQPMVPGDVPNTWADCSDLASAVGYAPNIPIETGVSRFVEWYRDYYRVDLLPRQ